MKDRGSLRWLVSAPAQACAARRRSCSGSPTPASRSSPPPTASRQGTGRPRARPSLDRRHFPRLVSSLTPHALRSLPTPTPKSVENIKRLTRKVEIFNGAASPSAFSPQPNPPLPVWPIPQASHAPPPHPHHPSPAVVERPLSALQGTPHLRILQGVASALDAQRKARSRANKPPHARPPCPRPLRPQREAGTPPGSRPDFPTTPQVVLLEGGGEVPFDSLCVASGAAPRLPFPPHPAVVTVRDTARGNRSLKAFFSPSVTPCSSSAAGPLRWLAECPLL